MRTKKCLDDDLCRSPISQSVAICLVNCTEDIFDKNIKSECTALLVLGSSMAADF